MDVYGVMWTHFMAAHTFDTVLPVYERPLSFRPGNGLDGTASYADTAVPAAFRDLGMIVIELFEGIAECCGNVFQGFLAKLDHRNVGVWDAVMGKAGGNLYSGRQDSFQM